MVRVERIERGHRLHAQALALRSSVLLEPIGYDAERFEAEYPSYESRFVHFVAIVDHPTGEKVIGTACLLPEEDGRGKLMQMAVDPQRQGEGVGRRLVVALEEHAFGTLGLRELFCHAQVPAVSFYERLGWSVVGEPFEEAGIEHRRMVLEGLGTGAGTGVGSGVEA